MTRHGVDTLDELGRLALVTAHAERGFNHARLRDLTSAHPRDITLKLQELLRKGLLVPSGPAVPPPTVGVGLRGKFAWLRGKFARLRAKLRAKFVRLRAKLRAKFVKLRANSDPRGWVAKDKQLEAVLAFCVDDWRTLPDIAVALDRTESTVRTKYLRPLLQQEALERRHPESPRHPYQAHRTVKRQRMSGPEITTVESPFIDQLIAMG
jgi:ATP-dependent DNA helicase RecG